MVWPTTFDYLWYLFRTPMSQIVQVRISPQRAKQTFPTNWLLANFKLKVVHLFTKTCKLCSWRSLWAVKVSHSNGKLITVKWWVKLVLDCFSWMWMFIIGKRSLYKLRLIHTTRRGNRTMWEWASIGTFYSLDFIPFNENAPFDVSVCYPLGQGVQSELVQRNSQLINDRFIWLLSMGQSYKTLSLITTFYLTLN